MERIAFARLTALEYQNGDLTQVKVNEKVRLVCDITTEISANNHVPVISQEQGGKSRENMESPNPKSSKTRKRETLVDREIGPSERYPLPRLFHLDLVMQITITQPNFLP